jgi:hypothetical protein
MVFETGLLDGQANAKEKRFVTRSYVFFAGLFLIPILILLAVQINNYRNGTSLFG